MIRKGKIVGYEYDPMKDKPEIRSMLDAVVKERPTIIIEEQESSQEIFLCCLDKAIHSWFICLMFILTFGGLCVLEAPLKTVSKINYVVTMVSLMCLIIGFSILQEINEEKRTRRYRLLGLGLGFLVGAIIVSLTVNHLMQFSIHTAAKIIVVYICIRVVTFIIRFGCVVKEEYWPGREENEDK